MEATTRTRRAQRITVEQVDEIIEFLWNGRSLRSACLSAGVHVKDFRWLRHGNSDIRRRVNDARAHSLLARARTYREQAAQLESRAAEIRAS